MDANYKALFKQFEGVSEPGPSLTRAQAAAYLGISHAFLKALDLRGEGPAAIRIGRRWTYLVKDLDAFREKHRIAREEA